MGMGNLQRMALQMQQEMERVQAELAETNVEGSAGGGVVRAVVTGKQTLVSITIDPSAVDPDDVDMLQDLVAVAVNEALDASRRLGRRLSASRAPPARGPSPAASASLCAAGCPCPWIQAPPWRSVSWCGCGSQSRPCATAARAGRASVS